MKKCIKEYSKRIEPEGKSTNLQKLRKRTLYYNRQCRMTGNPHSRPGFNSQDDFGASYSPLLLHSRICNPKGLNSLALCLAGLFLSYRIQLKYHLLGETLLATLIKTDT